MGRFDLERATPEQVSLHLTLLGNAAHDLEANAKRLERKRAAQVAAMVADYDHNAAAIAYRRGIAVPRLTVYYPHEYAKFGLSPVDGENLVYAIHGLQNVAADPGVESEQITSPNFLLHSGELPEVSKRFPSRLSPVHPSVGERLIDIFALAGHTREPQQAESSFMTYHGEHFTLSEHIGPRQIRVYARKPR